MFSSKQKMLYQVYCIQLKESAKVLFANLGTRLGTNVFEENLKIVADNKMK